MFQLGFENFKEKKQFEQDLKITRIVHCSNLEALYRQLIGDSSATHWRLVASIVHHLSNRPNATNEAERLNNRKIICSDLRDCSNAVVRDCCNALPFRMDLSKWHA